MKFNYTALSTDNQKLTGVLDAESLGAAQEELHKMGLSIISISEITEEDFAKQKEQTAESKQEGIQTFTFDAIDPNGKEINGTIDAVDDYSAYKRLIVEYKFKVNVLYLTDLGDAGKTQGTSKLSEFEAKMKEEGIDVQAIERKKGEIEEASERIDKKVVDEIDLFIINVKKVLGEHSDNFSPPFLKQIESTLGELERVRTSNNLKHIGEVCNQLYELISHPDQLEGGEEAENSGYQQILNKMKDTDLVRGEIDIHSKAVGLSKIESAFSKILKKLTGKDLTKLKKGKQKEKAGIHSLLGKLLSKKTKKEIPKPEIAKAITGPSSTTVIKKFFSYITAPNDILRRTRKQELSQEYAAWRKPKPKKVKTKAVKEKPIVKPDKDSEVATEIAKEKASKWDFTAFFMEMDSFVAWLLFFYVLFFYLVDFSLEKNVGLSKDFVIKTLKTPLILDITIFLLFAHLIFKIKNQYFRRNFLGSLFLVFFGFGIYTLLVINF